MSAFREEILANIYPQNLEWVANLTPAEIAHILNSVSIIPTMKAIKQPVQLDNAAANIGKRGENQFEKIVSQFMDNSYKLENSAKKPNSGDFLISWQSPKTNNIYKLLVDVKNYKSASVSTKEVEKLYRDLNMNTVDGGFMISLKSKITGFSKMVEFKDFYMETGRQLPVIFANTSTPQIICEIIKMTFHMIEIKDISQKQIQINNLDGLFYQVNQLNDSMHIITSTRNVLQESKNKIDKSLNDVMYKLMSCEYSLINKIAKINATLINHQDELKILEPESDIALTMIENIQQIFTIPESHIPFLHAIFNLGWDSSSVDIPKRRWVLIQKDSHATIKLFKGAIGIVFPVITTQMQTIMNDIKTLSKKDIRNTSAGVDIKITEETIGYVIKVCECLF
jgi:hypothetical protein